MKPIEVKGAEVSVPSSGFTGPTLLEFMLRIRGGWDIAAELLPQHAQEGISANQTPRVINGIRMR